MVNNDSRGGKRRKVFHRKANNMQHPALKQLTEAMSLFEAVTSVMESCGLTIPRSDSYRNQLDFSCEYPNIMPGNSDPVTEINLSFSFRVTESCVCKAEIALSFERRSHNDSYRFRVFYDNSRWKMEARFRPDYLPPLECGGDETETAPFESRIWFDFLKQFGSTQYRDAIVLDSEQAFQAIHAVARYYLTCGEMRRLLAG